MKDKSTFVIALAGLIFILPFKEQLAKINIDFGFTTTNILNLLFITFVLLLISIYFYALDYIRYGFKGLEDLILFKHFQFIANYLYFIALISLPIYLLIWGIVKVYRLILFLHFPQLIIYILPIISTVTAILSLFIVIKQTKNHRLTQEENIDGSMSISKSKIDQLVENRKWNLAIIEAFRYLELSINKTLLEIGLDAGRIPFSHSIELLYKKEIITKSEMNSLNFIRDLRNKAVHSSIEFTKEESLTAANIIGNILLKLENRTMTGFLFEKEVIKVLGGNKGLFPGHHIFPQYKIGNHIIDAKAEGPKYNYLIEITITINPIVINNAIQELKQFSGENIRNIMILPKSERKIDIREENTKILYYNPEKQEFENRDELYNWIYKVA